MEPFHGDESTSCVTHVTLPPSTTNTKKRQLPQWMLGVAGAETARERDSIIHKESPKFHAFAKNPNQEVGISNGEVQVEKRRAPKRVAAKPKKDGGSSKIRGAQKTGVEMDIGDNSGARDEGKKMPKTRNKIGSRMGGTKSRRKKKLVSEESISDFEEGLECQSEGLAVENGMDLTVEDLLSIAKQHVDAEEKNKDNGASADMNTKLQEPEKPSKKATSVFCNNEWKDLSYSTKYSEVPSSTIDKISRNICKSNISGEENFTLISQNHSNDVPSQVGMLDDVAQNMLDLLLGPSLEYSQNEDKNSQLLEELSSVQPLTESENKTEEAPIFKKKSSLRDKVTMLLS